MRCEAFGIVAQNEPFDINSVPELPLPQCTRMRCHCFYQEDGLDLNEERLSYRQYGIKSLDLD